MMNRNLLDMDMNLDTMTSGLFIPPPHTHTHTHTQHIHTDTHTHTCTHLIVLWFLTNNQFFTIEFVAFTCQQQRAPELLKELNSLKLYSPTFVGCPFRCYLHIRDGFISHEFNLKSKFYTQAHTYTYSDIGY